MSKLVEDVKAGIKGVRGMGDVLRGEVMEATDKAFEHRGSRPGHEADVRAQAKNQSVKEKGRADIQGMDDMFARREWARKENQLGETGLERGDMHTHEAVPGETQPATSEVLEDDHRLGAPVHRQPPVDTAHHRTGHPTSTIHQKPAETLGQEQVATAPGEATRSLEGSHLRNKSLRNLGR